MRKIERFFAFTLLVSTAVSACNLPTFQPNLQQAPEAEAVNSEPTATPTPAAAPVQNCSPTLVANTVANVRGGPGTEYNIVGSLPQGASAAVAGKNQDGTWWYIQFPGGVGGYAWIAASVTTATCIPATLAIIAAPPAPAAAAPTNTNVPGAPPPPPPSAIPTTPSGGGGPYYLDPGLIDPGIFYLLPTATPVFVMPPFEIPELPDFPLP